jgi:hypothetical protein
MRIYPSAPIWARVELSNDERKVLWPLVFSSPRGATAETLAAHLGMPVHDAAIILEHIKHWRVARERRLACSFDPLGNCVPHGGICESFRHPSSGRVEALRNRLEALAEQRKAAAASPAVPHSHSPSHNFESIK